MITTESLDPLGWKEVRCSFRAVKPKKAEIIGYEVPYGGVSMLAVEFYS